MPVADRALQKVLCLIVLLAVCLAVEASDPVDSRAINGKGLLARQAEVVDACTYGAVDVSFGRALGLSIALSVVLLLVVPTVALAAGLVLHVPFCYPGFAAGAALAPLVADQLIMAWGTWTYFGPGDAYVEGVSGNRLRFITLTLLAAFWKAVLLSASVFLAGAAFSDAVDERLPLKKGPLARFRACAGLIFAQGVSAAVTYYAFTRGVPSFWIGSDGDSTNPSSCSGPEAWAQMTSLVRFTEIAFVVNPFVAPVPFLGAVWGFADLMVGIFVIIDEQNAFHRSTAVYNLIFGFLVLLQVGGESASSGGAFDMDFGGGGDCPDAA